MSNKATSWYMQMVINIYCITLILFLTNGLELYI